MIVETAPEKPEIEQHDEKTFKKQVSFENKQKRITAFKDRLDSDGNVQLRERDKPKEEVRPKIVYPKVGDRVKSLFIVEGGKQEYFNGVVLKVNPKSYRIRFDDQDEFLMKKNEVKLI